MSEESEPETPIEINGNLGNGTLYIGGCAEFFLYLLPCSAEGGILASVQLSRRQPQNIRIYCRLVDDKKRDCVQVCRGL